MTKLSLPSGEWLMVAVPSDASDFDIDRYDFYYKAEFNGLKNIGRLKVLPTGDYSIYGADPLRLTEEEWAGIVDEPDDRGDFEKYTEDAQWCIESCCLTATESGYSLIRSNGGEVGEMIFLKVKK